MGDLLAVALADLRAKRADAAGLLAVLQGKVAEAERARAEQERYVAGLEDAIASIEGATPPAPETQAPARAAPGAVQEAILTVLNETGGWSLDRLTERTGHQRASVAKALKALVDAKRVHAAPGGLYWLPGTTPSAAAQ